MSAPADPQLAAPAIEASPPFWSAVREALAGSRRDYTAGPIGRAVLVLAVPMVLEMVMESVFAVCDVFFVGRLGAAAVATVGLTESMLALVYTLAAGLGIGATALVARRIGEKHPDAAARTAVQAVVLGLGLSAALGVAGSLAAPRLLLGMGATPDVVAIGSGYTRVMLGGSASILLLFLVNAIFRGAGDAAVAMRVLWIANGINIALGPCLIFGLGPFPRLGVTGAAVATTIGRSTGALIALWRLGRGNGHIRVARRHLRLEPATMLALVRLSGTATLQVLIGTASWIGLIRILSTFGSAALAGYTIGIRIILFALLPAWGMSNAAATMVGQALGAGRPERAEKAVWLTGLYNMAFLGAVGLAFVLFAGPIVRLFTADPAVRAYGRDALRIVALGFLFYAYGMVLGQAFNGAGDTTTPTLLNFGAFWAFEIPVAYVLAVHLRMGPHGVFVAITLAFSAFALAAAALFRRGRWKTRRV
ncbi:MAG TPA: MATE family efflux transporter [Longimicrobiales bacterium]|nr:MATE family efflux transporter [Longimicrobiales bacterium]